MPLELQRLGFHYPIWLDRSSSGGLRSTWTTESGGRPANLYRCLSITDGETARCHNRVVTPEYLVNSLQEFLSSPQNAVIMEDGGVIFDLTQSKYSISGEHNKCLLHVWSAERNVVRRVLDSEVKNGTLRLSVQRLGQSKPTKLEICRERDRRSPSAKRSARLAYQRMLQRLLQRRFPACKAAPLSSAMDLERSFGPIYARGLLRQGQSAFAVMGVNGAETQASIDAALTFGILWLDTCRQNQAGRLVIEGLKLFLPAAKLALTRERMAHLNPDAAKWQLYELEERSDDLKEIDICDRGNVDTRLVHVADETSAYERFAQPIGEVRGLMAEVQIAVLSPAEIAFRCNGLEFARARMTHEPGSFRSTTEIVFGIGGEETVLTQANLPRFAHLVSGIGEVRHAEGAHDHPLWRLHPERWLESLAVQNVARFDERLDPSCVYSQVPAFSASDRAMIDVLCATREGQLAVLEFKADEDIHLPLQGVDYWSRVNWHHERGEFQRFGFFPGQELSAEKPLLFLIAPALHVHPVTDTLLRYLSREIAWELVGIDERWREGVRVVFRKHPGTRNYSTSVVA